MRWSDFASFATHYVLPAMAIGLGITLWLFVGGVFGRYLTTIRSAWRSVCDRAADDLDRAGQALFRASKRVFGLIEGLWLRFARPLHSLDRRWDASNQRAADGEAEDEEERLAERAVRMAAIRSCQASVQASQRVLQDAQQQLNDAMAGDNTHAIEIAQQRIARTRDEAKQASEAMREAKRENGQRTSTITVIFASIAFVGSLALNGALLFDIAPDLLGFSPDFIAAGGWLIMALVPLAILFAEAGAGFVVKTAQGWGVRLMGMFLFLASYAIEVIAGIRRGISFLETASPFAGASTTLTTEDLFMAGLWISVAVVVPLFIFGFAMIVEPYTRESRMFGRVFRAVSFGLVWLAAGALAIALTTVVSAPLFAAVAVVGGVGVICIVLSFLVRHLVYGLGAIVVGVLVAMPSAIVSTFRRRPPSGGMSVRDPRGDVQRLRTYGGGGDQMAARNAASVLMLAMLLPIVFANSGCGLIPEQSAGGGGTPRFESVFRSDLTDIPDASVYSKEYNVSKMVGEIHKVVRVRAPRTHVCLADLTQSVRTQDLRQDILQKCSELVSGTSDMQGPETTGIVVPIVEAGLTSRTPTERLDRADVPSECVTNPPLPDLSRNTTFEGKMRKIRRIYEDAEHLCAEQVTAERQAAMDDREHAVEAFVKRVLSAFRGQSFMRTDVFGTMRLVEELVRQDEARIGGQVAVQVTIVSDLEDDANDCTVNGEAVECPSGIADHAIAFCHQDNVKCTVHQVRQATLASRRGQQFTREKRDRELRQDAWWNFWKDTVGAEVYTFTAPNTARQRVDPDPAPAPRQHAQDPAPQSRARDAQECEQAPFIKANLTAMQSLSLSTAQWISYGDALVACSPATSPWTDLGMSQAQYKRDVIMRFKNGDLAKANAFRNAKARAFKKLQHGW
ncbi:MAG: hypothetical protein ABIG71_00705 [Candidatus Uhrbacteria bacterium]